MTIIRPHHRSGSASRPASYRPTATSPHALPRYSAFDRRMIPMSSYLIGPYKATIMPLTEIPNETFPLYDRLVSQTEQRLEVLRTYAEATLPHGDWRMVLIRNREKELVAALPILITRGLPPHRILPHGFIKSIVGLIDRWSIPALYRLAVPRRVIVGNPFGEQFVPPVRSDIPMDSFAADLASIISHTVEAMVAETGAGIVTIPSLPQDHPLSRYLSQYGFMASEGTAPFRMVVRGDGVETYRDLVIGRFTNADWYKRLIHSGLATGSDLTWPEPMAQDFATDTRAANVAHNLEMQLDRDFPDLLDSLRRRNGGARGKVTLTQEELFQYLTAGGYQVAPAAGLTDEETVRKNLERMHLSLRTHDRTAVQRLVQAMLKGGYVTQPLRPHYEVLDDFSKVIPECVRLLEQKRNRNGVQFEGLNAETLLRLQQLGKGHVKMVVCRLVREKDKTPSGTMLGFQLLYFDAPRKTLLVKKTALNFSSPSTGWDVEFGLYQQSIALALTQGAINLEDGPGRIDIKTFLGMTPVAADNHTRFVGWFRRMIGPRFARQIERRVHELNSSSDFY